MSEYTSEQKREAALKAVEALDALREIIYDYIDCPFRVTNALEGNDTAVAGAVHVVLPQQPK